eukprot:3087739-Pyramimonas_sp.AAC.1
MARCASAGLGADDRRSSLEALGLQRAMEEGALARGDWPPVQGPTFTSAKKRRQRGREDSLDDGVEREPFFPMASPDDDLGDFEVLAEDDKY